MHLLAGVNHEEKSVQLKMRSPFLLIVFAGRFKGFLAAAFPCFHLSLMCWTFFFWLGDSLVVPDLNLSDLGAVAAFALFSSLVLMCSLQI